jgi:2-polyprenyl-6-hydroxyphenyl methylase/3-demethylubiquinone-9 3-methyltransferase
MTESLDTDKSCWDHSSHEDFYKYYANESLSEATQQRFGRVKDMMIRLARQAGKTGPLQVADIGCGAGSQSLIWATDGHAVRGLDVSEPLIRLARERAGHAGLDVSFEVGTATAVPWSDGTMDVCLLPELLEHVADWQACVREATRVLAPGGLLYLSTTNVLCPKQQEFNLPLYSWYPPALKRHCERMATTTRPAIANYAKYPAVNWFSYYGLRSFLRPFGFRCLDRFDTMEAATKSPAQRIVLRALRGSSLLRFLGHVATPSTVLVAVKA